MIDLITRASSRFALALGGPVIAFVQLSGAATPLVYAQSAGTGHVIAVQPGGSIQAAIDNATNNARIVVPCGSYVGGLRVTKPVEIDGSGPCTVIHGETSHGITVASGNVVLRDFSVLFKGGTGNLKGIIVSGASNLLCENLQVTDSPADGLAIYNSSRITIRGGNYSSNGTSVAGSSGILLHDTQTASITGVRAWQNQTAGVKVESSAQHVASDVTISYNTLRENGSYGAMIVGTGVTTRVEVSHNTAALNGVDNINAHRTTFLTVSDNVVVGSSTRRTRGISLDNVGSADVENNLISGCGSQSLLITTNTIGSQFEKVTHNTIEHAQGPPTQFNDLTGLQFTDNTILDVPRGQVGVYTFHCPGAVISSNTIIGGTSSAIYIGSPDHVGANDGSTVTNNRIRLSAPSNVPAIQIFGGRSHVVSGNTTADGSRSKYLLNNGALVRKQH